MFLIKVIAGLFWLSIMTSMGIANSLRRWAMLAGEVQDNITAMRDNPAFDPQLVQRVADVAGMVGTRDIRVSHTAYHTPYLAHVDGRTVVWPTPDGMWLGVVHGQLIPLAFTEADAVQYLLESE